MSRGMPRLTRRMSSRASLVMRSGLRGDRVAAAERVDQPQAGEPMPNRKPSRSLPAGVICRGQLRASESAAHTSSATYTLPGGSGRSPLTPTSRTERAVGGTGRA